MIFSKELKVGSRTKWLLSETLVVVLGVLIALGINDYWTQRQEQSLELQYLKRIHEDVTKDADVIDDWFGDGLQKKRRALEEIAPIVRGSQPAPEELGDFLRKVVSGGRGGTSATRWVTSTTIEDLKSTGNLRLIRNVDLRRKIARYYHDMEMLYIRSRDRRTGYTAFVFSQLPMKISDNPDEELNLDALRGIDSDRVMERFRSLEFQELLMQEMNLAVFRSRITSAASKQLARDLEQYIHKLGGAI